MRKNKIKILFTTLVAAAAMVLSGCSETVPDPVLPEPPVTETPATIAIAPYQGEKGTIIPSALVAEVGADISFTITPAGDYDLFGLKVNGEALKIEDLAYDPVTDAYTWNTTVAEAGFLFEPDFIEEAAVIEADENVVIDGTYSRYWIKSEGNWALGQADLTKTTLMLDFEDGNDDDLLTLPEWNKVVGEVVTLNDATYSFAPVGTSAFQICLPLKISGNYEFGSRGRFNLAGLPEGVEAYEVSDATFTFNEAVTSGGALFVGADAKLALSNVKLINGVDVNGVEVKALESYTNFGDLSNLSISASDLGGVPLALTHVGKVEVDGSTLGSVVINQNMVGNYFSFTNNNFGGVDKKVSPISVSKVAGVHMVGTSKIEGNTWNANDTNVVNGDGLSYKTMFTSTELVFGEDVVVKDGLWSTPAVPEA